MQWLKPNDQEFIAEGTDMFDTFNRNNSIQKKALYNESQWEYKQEFDEGSTKNECIILMDFFWRNKIIYFKNKEFFRTVIMKTFH